jgi:3-oxoacyl-[acyl-carrier-protein] synthase II
LKRRVVITGGGVVSAIGIGLEAFWESCLQARSAVAAVPPAWLQYAELRSRVWSPLPQIDHEALGITRTERLQLDPFAVLALGASREALTNAGFSLVAEQRPRALSIAGEDPSGIGVFMGTGIGGAHTFLHNHSIHLSHGPRYHPFVVAMLMPNAASAVVANKYSIRGPNLTYCVACASGTVAIGHAYRAVRDGEVALAVSGGAESLYDEHGHIFRGFDVAGTLVRECADPEKANRPFDEKRSGFLFSQGGAAVLVLEELEHALRRRAPVMAELVGFAETFDAHSMMSLAPGGGEIERMLRASLADAGLEARAVGYVNAHGTGTQNNDAIEGEVIRRVFGDAVAVNSTKSILGHTIGASGAFEALVTALTLRDGCTHINRNLDAPCTDLNFVRSTRAFGPEVGLSQSFAFGGHNAALVLRRWTGGGPPG